MARTSGQASTTPDIQIRDLTSNQKFFILNGSLFSVALLRLLRRKAKLRVSAVMPSHSQLHQRQILWEPICGSTVSFFLSFSLLLLLSMNPKDPTHPRFIRGAHVSCTWNYSTSYYKKCQNKKVESVCCFIYDFQIKSNFPIHPPYTLSRWVPECVYIWHICRGCDAWEAREDQWCMDHCSVLKMAHKL